MLRALAVALSLAVIPATALAERVEPPVQAEVVAFPLPKDAKAPEMTKGGGGRIGTYNVPRGRAVVTAEVRAALKRDRWEIVKDEPSPSGNATRIQAKKAGQLWKVSFTGDEARTVIILTRP
ncbi:MAG: hypothetical protein H0T46_12490 [Deltaproteobacteria bacterium]|nr:hypothetical protein [Deltaproteobacteria bacterium]